MIYVALLPLLNYVLVLGLAITALFVAFGVSLLYSPTMQRLMIYVHWLRLPLGDLRYPERFGLSRKRARNLRIKTSDGVTIGAWHLCPIQKQKVKEEEEVEACKNESFYPKQIKFERSSKKEKEDCLSQFILGSESSVILYFHGNAGNRGASFRISSYQALCECSPNSHLLVIDYRGFGDSDCVQPTEQTIVFDAIAAYDFLTSHGVLAKNISIVGQSLGTAVAVMLAAERIGACCILISPFTTAHEMAFAYPNTRWACWLLELLFGKDRARNLVRERLHDVLDTETRVRLLPGRMPLYVLHGAADNIVPVNQGHRVSRAAAHDCKTIADNGEIKWRRLLNAPDEGYLEECVFESSMLGAKGTVKHSQNNTIEYAEITHAAHNDVFEHNFVLGVISNWLNTTKKL